MGAIERLTFRGLPLFFFLLHRSRFGPAFNRTSHALTPADGHASSRLAQDMARGIAGSQGQWVPSENLPHQTSHTRAQQQQASVERLAAAMRTSALIADRKYRLTTYPKCFVGSEAAQWMIESKFARDIDEAVSLGNQLFKGNFIHHCLDDHDEFKPDYLFYKCGASDFVPSIVKNHFQLP